MQCKSKCHSTPHDCFFTFWHFYVTQELPPRQAPDLLTFRQQRIFSCLFNRRRKTRFEFITFSSASYTNQLGVCSGTKTSSYQIPRPIKGRNAWLEMLGVLSFLSWIRLHAEDQTSFSVSSVGVSLVSIMSGKVTLFISGISGSKEVFFVKFNDFLQIALRVDLNNVLIFKQSSVTRGVSDS